jgi:mono/diheme cytochrome c family protein
LSIAPKSFALRFQHVLASVMGSAATVLATCFGAKPAAAAEEAPHAVMNAQHRMLLQDYCQKCHGAEKQKGKFRVDDLPFAITTLEAAERWQKVLNQMNSGDMPPDDEKQPDRAAKANFLDDLANTMVAARRGLGDQHGVITMRRLNRREYRNTLRELLGVEINVSELPSDTGTGGFDTVGSNLFMSGNQFEQYQALGREALEEASERQANAAVEKKFHYEAEAWTPMVEKFVAHQIDARERAQQWVKAVEEAAARPENAEAVAEVWKLSKNEAIFRRYWEKIPGAPNPRAFGFDKKGENDADLANDSLGAGWLPYHQYYLQQPALDRGAWLGVQTRHPSELNLNYMELLVPFGWPVGEYVVRARVAAKDDAPPERRFLEFGIDARGGQILSTNEVIGTLDAPQTIEIPLTMTRGNAERANRTLFFREKGSWDTNEEGQRKRGEAVKRNGIGPEFALWVDWLEIERKPDADKPKPPGLAALGLALDDKSPAPATPELRAALERFATEAFRGTPPPATYLDRLLRLYDVRLKAGDKPGAALKETLSVVLSSPMFLYLAEPAADEKHRPLSDAELATRLAYFLWSAPPDATLRDLAGRGELRKPEVLAAQTERLLDDPRSEGFLTPFTHQWLGLDRLDFFQVNLAMYPRFDNGTKLAARHEIFETIAYLFRQNASLRDLLKSDYAVINSVLANYYGLDGVQGDEFRKVALPKDSPRGGLLGMAAIQFMGGNGEHTSPVERGAWVLRKLLDDPPPPAPANVPALTRLAGKVLTTRERMQAHQEDPQCASCHRKIDPIGFGLENFDAAGQWRTEDSYTAVSAMGKPDPKSKKTWTIDPAATLHNGPAFHDYFGLRDVVASRADHFARGFSTALIEYALGRPCGFSDEPLLADLVRQTRDKDFAAREFIHALVRSKEFHTK